MVEINVAACVGCGKCVKDCIAENIGIEQGKAAVKAACFQCGHCVAICPEGAVSIPEYDMEDVEEGVPILDGEALLHTIKFRRSIRDFKQIPVEQEKLEKLLQAGGYTATAKNSQGCTFVFVQKELEQLKKKVWDFIDRIEEENGWRGPKEMLPYLSFNKRRKADPADDYLFRNAPVVVFITADYPLDPGLAAQNMELTAVTQGLGVLFNGFLARIADENAELKDWLGISGKQIKACMLLGYPAVSYKRTAPRKEGTVIWR